MQHGIPINIKVYENSNHSLCILKYYGITIPVPWPIASNIIQYFVERERERKSSVQVMYNSSYTFCVKKKKCNSYIFNINITSSNSILSRKSMLMSMLTYLKFRWRSHSMLQNYLMRVNLSPMDASLPTRAICEAHILHLSDAQMIFSCCLLVVFREGKLILESMCSESFYVLSAFQGVLQMCVFIYTQ